jgi:N-acetylmuramoyl-L-alanine amidase
MKSVTKSSTYQRLAWLLIALLAIPHAGFQPAARMSNEIRTVVIDAGHGGKDPGNLGTRRYKKTEKDVSLAVALLVEKYILERHPNIKVVMTRRDDSYPTLHERTVIANRAQGDVFISIHCDAAENRSAYGSSTYVMGKDHDDENRVAMRENSVILQEDNQDVYEGFDPTKPESYIMLTMFQYAFIQQSVELAQQVQNSFRDDVGRKDRGVKQQPLYVTSRSAMPAILIELGFLTNSAEEDYLITDQGQDEMARSIARSFGQYKLRREGGISAAAEPKVEPVAEPTALAVPLNTEPKAEPAKAEEKPAAAPGASGLANQEVFFSIQLSVSGIQKNPTEEPFSALPDVFVAKDGRLFRYLQGRYRSRTEAISALESARKSGFTDAFVVAYRGLARITLDEADQALKP